MSPVDDRPGKLFHFAYAAALVALALSIQYLIDSPGHLPAFQLSLLVIAIIAFLFSSSVALFSVLLSALGQKLLFLSPLRTLWITNFSEAIQFCLFILVSLTLCYVIERLKRARSANDVTLRELIRANRARQLSDLRLESGFNSIEDAVLLLDSVRDANGVIQDFTIAYLNNAAAALNEGGAATREAQIGRRLSEVGKIHYQHGLVEGYIAALVNGAKVDREVIIESPGNKADVREVQVRVHRMGDSVVVHWRDVSDYRRAQSTSLLSEGRYQSLVEAMGAIVWNTQPNGQFETPQLEWSVFTGQKFEELRGMGWLNAVHPDDRARTAQQWGAAMANQRSLDVDYRLRRSDGQYRAMHVRAVPILDQSGNVQEWLGVHTDITDRARAEEIIADSERRHRQLIEGLPIMSWSCTAEGVCDYINPGWVEYTGRTVEELLGIGWLQSVHVDDRATLMTTWENSVRTGKPMAIEFRIRGKDGVHRWHDTRAVPLHDAAGKVIKWFGTNLDTDGRRRAEQRFRRLYETNLVGIVYYNSGQELFDPNEAFLAILGYGPSEKNKRLNSRDLTPPEWQLVDQEQRKALLEHGKCGPYEKQFYRSDGSRVNVMIAAADIDPGNHEQGAAFVVDLTPVKKVEEALRKSEADLRSVNESLEGRIRERTNELQLRSDQLRALALDLTETESRERKRLAQLLHDHFQQLVSAAKLKVGIIRRKIADPALLETIGQAESLLAETIDASRNLATELSPPVLHDGSLRQALEWLGRKMERDHELHVEIEIESEAELDNEQVRVILFECVRELLFNVVKHSGTLQAKVEVSVSSEGLLQVVVRDNGKGFDPNQLESLARPDGSFGLLSIKERLALLGGLVRIHSEPGVGTSTIISVPVAVPTRGTPQKVADREAKPRVDREPSAVPSVQVLVADDHRLFREGLISLISQEPFVNVIGQANDGEEAIELARELKPDILLCDITMPKLNGVQVTAQLSREMPELRIIGLSMHEREDMANAMLEAGAVAYCTKGGPTDTLLAVLREVANTSAGPNRPGPGTVTPVANP